VLVKAIKARINGEEQKTDHEAATVAESAAAAADVETYHEAGNYSEAAAAAAAAAVAATLVADAARIARTQCGQTVDAQVTPASLAAILGSVDAATMQHDALVHMIGQLMDRPQTHTHETDATGIRSNRKV